MSEHKQLRTHGAREFCDVEHTKTNRSGFHTLMEQLSIFKIDNDKFLL